MLIFIGFAVLLLTSCLQLPADSDPDIYFFGFTVQINNLPNLDEHLESIHIDVVDQEAGLYMTISGYPGFTEFGTMRGIMILKN